MSKPQLLKYSEWQSGSGRWFVNDISDLTSVRSMWWIPARLLEISLDNFILMLKNDFKVDYLTFNGKTLIYSWAEKNYSNAHKFLLFINRKAREKNFII